MRQNRIFVILWKKIILPKSNNRDEFRREFILNILLSGFIFLGGIAFLLNVIHPFLYPTVKGENILITGSIFVFFCSLLFLSRHRKSKLASFLLILLLFCIGIYGNYSWGADLPAFLLLFALLIVVTGVLIGTKAAFLSVILSACSILLFSYLEISGVYVPMHAWKREPLRMADSFVHVIVLGVIVIVSWLSNREIEKSLRRARSSELALQKQKSQLEVLVEKRTRELRQVEAEKLMQLYRFALFGRIASGLFHDLVNPLGLITLNLDRLTENGNRMKQKEIKRLLERAQLGTKQIENFVFAARKQMQNKQVLSTFSLKEEMMQVKQILSHKMKKSHTSLSFQGRKDIKMNNNSIKFSQLMTNLIGNAIDSYDMSTKQKKQISVLLKKQGKNIKIIVQDWGSGIQEKHLPKIFDPLFTTKDAEKGTGMGLAICKDIIEKDFHGKIQVKSKVNKGTTFTITFPHNTSS